MNKKALLVVDVQNDFCPGGALPVPEGDKVVPIFNKYIKLFANPFRFISVNSFQETATKVNLKGHNEFPIFATRDWHPKETKHFKDFGGLWPVHCVQETRGAMFHPDLNLPEETIILSKGMHPERDSYSAFQAYDSQGNSFLNLLNSLGIKELYIGGLATDYCVKASVLDALKHGFKVKLLTDAIRGVNQEDSRQAIEEMVKEGASKVTFDSLNL